MATVYLKSYILRGAAFNADVTYHERQIAVLCRRYIHAAGRQTRKNEGAVLVCLGYSMHCGRVGCYSYGFNGLTCKRVCYGPFYDATRLRECWSVRERGKQ